MQAERRPPVPEAVLQLHMLLFAVILHLIHPPCMLMATCTSCHAVLHQVKLLQLLLLMLPELTCC